MAFRATKQKVLNRGIPPDSFLDELIAWGRTAADDIFAPNENADVYSSVVEVLGPWQGPLHRRAGMLEVMRVLAGFESSWNWNAGVDTTNPTSTTPTTIEAGAWQVSANSMSFGPEPQGACSAEGRLTGWKRISEGHEARPCSGNGIHCSPSAPHREAQWPCQAT
ncbi:hypothetical protein ACVOMS_27660 [Bradyrhizobium guangxiense]